MADEPKPDPSVAPDRADDGRGAIPFLPPDDDDVDERSRRRVVPKRKQRPKPRGDLVMITLAENDAANGMEQGFVTAMHIHDDDDDIEVELESRIIRNGDLEPWGPVCRSEMGKFRRYPDDAIGKLRVGRVVVPIFGHRTWFGNWCWNAYTVRATDARRIVHYLLDRKYFGVEMHVCGTEFLPAHLRD